MKTIRFFMMFVAVATMMFAVSSCKKDDDKKTSELSDNTLIYNGTEYEMVITDISYFHSELTLLSAASVDFVDGEPKVTFDGLHIRPATWNKTVSLTSPAEGEFWGSFELYGNGINFGGWGMKEDGELRFGGHIDETDYENESIFRSGTFTVSGKNDGTPITVILDGVLKNGKKVQMKLVSGNYPTAFE